MPPQPNVGQVGKPTTPMAVARKDVLPVGEACGGPLVPGSSFSLLAQQSPFLKATYDPRVAMYNNTTWATVFDSGDLNQNPIAFVDKLGGNLYRIQGFSDGFAIVHPGQLQRSTDHGVTWTNVGPAPITSGSDIWGVQDIDIGADGVLWLCTCPDNGTGKLNAALLGARVYKSTDNGVTWTQAYEDATKDTGAWRSMFSVMPHPTDPLTIAFISNYGAAASAALYITTDGGTSFTRNTGGAGNAVSGRQGTMLSTGRVIHLAGNSGTIYRSDNNGVSWTNTGVFFSSRQVQILKVGDILFANGGGASVPSVKRSDDLGVTWQNWLQDNIDAGSSIIVSIYYAPIEGVMYAATNGTGSTRRVYRVATPLAPISGARELTSEIDITANLDSLFLDTDPNGQIGRLGLIVDSEFVQGAGSGPEPGTGTQAKPGIGEALPA